MDLDDQIQKLESVLAALRQARGSNASAAATDAPPAKRQALTVEQQGPLEHEPTLRFIFSLVGPAEYLYVGLTCRHWRGLYMSYSANLKKGRRPCKPPLITNLTAAMVTAARMKIALAAGLTNEQLEEGLLSQSMTCTLVSNCCDLVEMLTLLRIRGLPWPEFLTTEVAHKSTLQVLQWLHESGCTFNLPAVYKSAADSDIDALAKLQWLQSVTEPWSPALLQELQFIVGCTEDRELLEWLRATFDLDWPDTFVMRIDWGDGVQSFGCWPLSNVQYAFAHGCGWGDWSCKAFNTKKFTKLLAADVRQVFAWAHHTRDDCPCTCEADGVVVVDEQEDAEVA